MAVSAQDTTLRAIVKMIDMEYLSELVRAYDGDRYCKSLNVQKMFIALLVGMLRGLKSLRDIECFTEDY